MTRDRIIELYVNCTMCSGSCTHCLEFEKEECDRFYFETEALSIPREYTLKEVLQLCVKGGIFEP